MRLYSKTIRRIALTSIIILMAGFAMLFNSFETQAEITHMLNFAGKVTNINGSEVTDGNYDFSFSLYDASTGGTELWTETLDASTRFAATIAGYDGTDTYTYTSATATSTLRIGQHLTNANTGESVLITAFDTSANTITVVSGSPAWTAGQTINTVPYVEGGVIDENLGSVTDLSGVNFNQPVYLEITFNGETMQPRKMITAVAQAFNADKLDGYDASEFANLSADSIVTGSWTFNNNTTIVASSTATALTITQNGSGDIVNFFDSSGTEVFTVTGAGNFGIGTSTPENKLDIFGDLGIRDQNDFRLYELSSNGNEYVGFRASSTLSSSLVWTLPTTAGSSGEALMVNSNGDLEWGTASQGTVNIGTAGYLPYYASDGDTLTATSSLFIASSSKIGIGKTNPTTTLDINGDFRVSYSETLVGDASQTDNTAFSAGTNSSTAVSGGDVILGREASVVGANTYPVRSSTLISNFYGADAVDVNNDGYMDILLASYTDDHIYWYENDGSQNFTENNISTTINGANDVKAIDLDGDGDMDAVSVSAIDGDVFWHENNGSQVFADHAVYASAPGVRSVDAADMNGDGYIDVVSASYTDNTIRWYENDGLQNFTPHIIYSSATGAYDVYVVDIDGDGDKDVLSASYSNSTVIWYENDGIGGFTTHIIYLLASGVRGVYAEDVDGDGDIDVLSASYTDDTIRWYENDGSENFTPHIIYALADGANNVYAKDMDRDGDIDVLSASYLDADIRWYENDGSENFTPHTIDASVGGASYVLAPDIDGDGDPDVLATGATEWNINWYETTGGNYLTSGDFTSSAIDTGQDSTDYSTLDFGITEVLGTTNIEFQLRSASTEAGLTSATWYGPTGVGDYYTSTGETINSIHDGDQYIQLKAYLTTTDISQTPTLHDFTINYNYYGGIFNVSTQGVVTSGTWNGGVVGVDYGGTGLSSVTDGYFLVGNNSTTLEATSSIYMSADGYIGLGTTNPSQQLTLTGNLELPNTTYASQYGVIYKNGNSFIHNFNYGNNGSVTTNGLNTFFGENSGNFTMGSGATSVIQASYNTGIGAYTLSADTTGYYNTAVGNSALRTNTTGYYNVALGGEALYSNATGAYNTAVGSGALHSNTASYNTAIGSNAGRYITSGSANTLSSNSVYLGYDTRALSSLDTNTIVIGHGATGIGSNSVVLGNDNILKTALKGDVGIGTTNPDAPLHVVKGSGYSGTRPTWLDADVLVLENADGYSTALNLLSSSDASSYIAFSTEGVNGAGYISYVPAAYSLHFSASGTIPLVVSGDGTVGIGTSTSPEATLHVAKGSIGTTTRPTWLSEDVAIFENDVNENTSLQILSAYNKYSSIYFSDNYDRDVGGIIYNHSDDSMTFRAGSSSSMIIANNGYVGIGTNNPIVPLSLQGSAGQAIFNIASSTGDSIFYIDAQGEIGIGTQTPDASLMIAATSTAQLKLAYTGSAHQASFTVGSDGTFTIESNEPGDVYIDPTSKLGVGTSSPQSTLTIYGDVFIEGTDRYVNFGGVAGSAGYGIRDNAGTLEIKNSGTAWTPVTLVESGQVGWVPRYYENSPNLQATSSIFISNAGYVGIGDQSPTSQLSLGGDVDMNNHNISEIGFLDIGSVYGYGLRFNSGSSNSSITWGNDSTHQFGGVDLSSVKINTGALDSGTGVSFGPYGDAPTASINANGTLTLNGYAFIGGARLTLSETSNRASSSILVQTSQGIPFLEFATSSGEVYMFVNKDGWLGLNTNTPDVSLHVGSANPDKVSGIENAYVEGSVEIDGVLYVDGVATSSFLGGINLTGAFSAGSNNFYINNSGVVTSGTWQGGTIDVTYGGTGLSSVTDGYFLVGTGGSSLEATSSIFMANNGYIGIGTTTPDSNLVLVNETAAGSDTLFKVATSSNVFRITGAGDVYADGSFIDTGADYAEYFYTLDTDLSAGEVVCVDITNNNAVERCTEASDTNVMGIISTKPAIIGNARSEYSGNRHYVVVGMLGQVPAKVSDENGVIRPGDSLTSAGISGYIMKANPGDSTVGVALESFGKETASGTPAVVSTGEIKVLISRRNKSLTVEMVESKITDHIASMEIEDEVELLIANAVDTLNLGDEIQPIVDEQIALFDDRLSVEFDSVTNQLTNFATSIDRISERMNILENSLSSISLEQDRINNRISEVNEQLILLGASGQSNLNSILVDSTSGLVITNNEYRDESEPAVSIVEIVTATSTQKTAFVVNQLGDGDVVDFQADGVSIVNIADDGKVSVVGEMSIDGRLMVCAGAGCGDTLDEAVDGTMGDMGVEGKVVAGAFESVCEDGFVWVPGSSKYGTMPGFCVMASEARVGADEIPTTDLEVEGHDSSIWVNVSQGEAQLACQAMGDNYHLITENEWLTIAENIIRVGENDIDPDKIGLQLATSSAATSVEFTLSNGNKVYDLVGSVSEWTDMVVTKAGLIQPTSDDWQEYYDIIDFRGFNIAPPYFYDSSNGIGRIKVADNDNGLRGFVRGETSLYDLDLSDAPTTVSENIGFRCSK